MIASPFLCWLLHSLLVSVWFWPSPLQRWVLSRPWVRSPEQTDKAQWPAHWCQAFHHAELYLHPQDRGKWRDPAHLLLLSGNRPVERAGHRARRGDNYDARSTRILPYQLCWEGKVYSIQWNNVNLWIFFIVIWCCLLEKGIIFSYSLSLLTKDFDHHLFCYLLDWRCLSQVVAREIAAGRYASTWLNLSMMPLMRFGASVPWP